MPGPVPQLFFQAMRDGWDGEWYRRAFFDDGTPLGTATDEECRIDSIVQSWGVLSGAAKPARGVRATAAVGQQLVRRPENLVLITSCARNPRGQVSPIPRVPGNAGCLPKPAGLDLP